MKKSDVAKSIVLKPETTETHKTGGLKNTQHGVRFQLKLVYFFICRAVQLKNESFNFKISTEYSDADSFDDLVFLFPEDNRMKYRCVQCKHKQDDSNKFITWRDLLELKKDFYLPKYFESYRSIIKDSYFKQNVLKDLIILTNIGFKHNDTKSTLTLNENEIFNKVYDDFLEIELYKFKEDFPGRKLIVDALLANRKKPEDLTEVESFMEYFRFAVKYPNEERLSEMINGILSEIFQLRHIDFVSDLILRVMWDWLSDKIGTTLNINDAKYLLDRAECLGCKYKLTGLTETYINILKTYNITFSGSILDLNVLFETEKQILKIVSPNDTILSALNVLQTLLSELKQHDSFVFLPIEAILLNKKTIVKSFKLDTENILVINVDRDEDKYYLVYNEIIDILNQNDKKKVIILTKQDETILTSLIEAKYKEILVEQKADFIDFLSLSEKSRSVLLNKCISFQGYEVKLSEILTQDKKKLKELIDCEFLIRLVKNSTISIGNQMQNLGEVSNYFIERYFERSDKTYDYKDVLELEEKLILLSAEAGMGKSIILTKIAEKIKERSHRLWITRVNLNNFSNELRNSSFVSKDDCISFLIKTECLKTNFEKQLYRSLFEEDNRIVILFDGFDEISPVFNMQVQKLVKILRSTKIAQIWLSTRPHLKKELEEDFKVESFELIPLTENEQNTLFLNFWTFNIPTEIINIERIKHFQQKLLQIVTGVVFGDNNEFIQVPLQLIILSEAYIDDLIEFIQSEREDPNIHDNINMISLFERFINRKFSIYSKEKAKHAHTVAASEDIEKLKIFFVYKHKIASVFELIDSYFLEKMISAEEENTYDKFLKELENGRERTGIITEVIVQSEAKSKINFSHRTFSEYFLALWFADKVGNKNRRDINVLEFMYNHLFKFEYLGTRKFFDFLSILGVQTKLHAAVINNNFSQVQYIIDQPSLNNEMKNSVINETDTHGRTALHLAVMYERGILIDFLLKHEVDLNTKDTLFNLRAIQCAYHLESWKIMETLVSNGCYTNDLFELSSGKHLTMIRSVLRFDYEKLALVVFNEVLKPNNHFFDEKVQQREGIFIASLNLAAKCGEVNVVGHLLSFDMLIHYPNWRDSYDSYKNTALHLAAREGHLEVAKHLIELINEQNINNETPLLTAIRFGRVDICQYLVKKGAKIEHKNINGETPLHYAAKFGNIEIVKFLLENNAQINSRDKFAYRPIHRAAAGGHLEIVQYLVEAGADKEARLRQRKGNSPLHVAIKHGHIDIYLYLIAKGADQKPNTCGRSLLHFAVSGDQPTMAEYLITNKICELETVDSENYSAFNLAAKLGHINILRYLRSLNANIESENSFGETALFSAASKGRLDVVKYLVEECGANREAKNNKGQTPFHTAVRNHRNNVVEYLIDKVNVNTEDENLNTPLHRVAQDCDYNIAKLLIDARANVLAQNDEGNTPLHLCFKYKDIVNHKQATEQFTSFLLENGARDDIENNNKEVPKNCTVDVDIIDMFSEPEMRFETEDEREWYGPLNQSNADDNNNEHIYSREFCM